MGYLFSTRIKKEVRRLEIRQIELREQWLLNDIQINALKHELSFAYDTNLKERKENGKPTFKKI